MNIPRDKFPLLTRLINGKQLVYFDYAATSPKPQGVIDAISTHYSMHSANPGRSTHTLSLESSKVIAEARKDLLSFLHGDQSHSVIFTKNATEALNLIAHSLQEQYQDSVQKPTIITTEAEHHSNFLPWLRLHKQYNFPLVIIPVEADGTIDEEKVCAAITNHPFSILAITHCSNVTGQIVDVQKITPTAQKNKTLIVLDASQSIVHCEINLQELYVDYFVASAHKMYGPEGVGILAVKKELIQTLSPLLVGGGIVETVTSDSYSLKLDEEKFEAGTQNTSALAGFIAALHFLKEIGFETIGSTEKMLTEDLLFKLGKIPQLTIIRNNEILTRAPVVAFSHKNIHPHDIADFLDQEGIAVRAGNHCAEPLHKALGLKGSVRVSLSFLNTKDEIDYLISSLLRCLQKYE